jgi:hypothetical protein
MAIIEVYLNDNKMNYDIAEQYFFDADLWARKNCSSYKGHDVQDVADFSYSNDLIALYLFEDKKDAMWFKLKWQND